jgi:hypothetical protein
MHGQENLASTKHTVEIPRNGLACHFLTVVKGLAVGGVWVCLRQVVPIAVFVEGVFQGVAVGRKLWPSTLVTAHIGFPNTKVSEIWKLYVQ